MTRRKVTFIFWSSFLLSIFLGAQAILALRSNALQAVALRDNVLQVDKQNGDVEAALMELRAFVHGHMNTDLSTDTSVYPPIQLKYTYDRLVAAERSRVEKATATVYADAQKYCENKNSADFSGRNRVPCISKYVTDHKVTERPIEDDLYKFDFASPVWSPDRAGLSLFGALILLATAGIAFLLRSLIPKK